ncbi:MAG: TonB-dependent receptor [Proteobacteria bacterium]|nr:TonB-dependent receptor [Pseudomonadota bacterium]
MANRNLMLSLLVGSSTLVAGTASAQTAPASSADTLGEIVVTAQRREQRLQDVPIAVQVMSTDLIEKVAADDIAQINRLIPGLVVSADSPTQPHYQLRGIGASDFGVGTEPAVGVYVDGVYASRSGASFLAFNDIERIEVLKGPQGTLLGRSSAAGAISIVTKKPTDTFEGSLDARWGNEAKQRYEGMLNVPFGSGMALRLNLVTNQSDGYLRDAATGHDLNPERNWSGRAAFRWDIDDATQVMLAWNHDKVNQLARPAIGILPPGAVPTPVGPTDTGSTWLNPITAPIYNDVIGNEESRTLDEFVLNFNRRFGDIEFHSTTDWRQFHTKNLEDEDGTNQIATYFDTANLEHNAAWYQEFRLSGKTKLMDWVAGVSYSSEHAQQASDTHTFTDGVDTTLVNLGYAPPPGLFGLTSAVITQFGFPSLMGLPWRETMYDDGKFKSLGVFGDVIWHLTDQLNLTTGVRYSHDQKDFAWLAPYRDSPQLDAILGSLVQAGLLAPNDPRYYFNLVFGYGQMPGVNYAYSTSGSWSDLSPRVVLDYRLNPNAMVYASIAKGFTPGGFDSVQVNGRYDNEDVWNYEIGLKSAIPNAHLLVNAAIYDYVYKNKQSLILDTTSGGVPEYVTSTSDQKAYGLDLEARWQPVTPLTFGLTAAYINSTYKKFVSQYGFDLAGQPTGEPSWSFSASADYSVPFDDGSGVDIFIVHSYRGAVRCNDESLATKTCLPQAQFPLGVAENITDARVAWHSPTRKWSVAVYGNNVFDNRYVTGIGGLVAATFGTPTGSVNAPRRYGLDVHASF